MEKTSKSGPMEHAVIKILHLESQGVLQHIATILNIGYNCNSVLLDATVCCWMIDKWSIP
ncbi:hypothetical protein Sjap_013517 [Stephania japonica]|uniref:Uncharacterized protein n=1 Tax=Stephania japonica TaxID=461633 RepID=A0AAP0IZ90_9MAGN